MYEIKSAFAMSAPEIVQMQNSRAQPLIRAINAVFWGSGYAGSIEGLLPYTEIQAISPTIVNLYMHDSSQKGCYIQRGRFQRNIEKMLYDLEGIANNGRKLQRNQNNLPFITLETDTLIEALATLAHQKGLPIQKGQEIDMHLINARIMNRRYEASLKQTLPPPI